MSKMILVDRWRDGPRARGVERRSASGMRAAERGARQRDTLRRLRGPKWSLRPRPRPPSQTAYGIACSVSDREACGAKHGDWEEARRHGDHFGVMLRATYCRRLARSENLLLYGARQNLQIKLRVSVKSLSSVLPSADMCRVRRPPTDSGIAWLEIADGARVCYTTRNFYLKGLTWNSTDAHS